MTNKDGWEVLFDETNFHKKAWKTFAIISVCLNLLLLPAACAGPPMTPKDIASMMLPKERAAVILELQMLQREEAGR